MPSLRNRKNQRRRYGMPGGRHFSAEDKVRVVVAGPCGEDTVAEPSTG
jgi:hypothetical protein